MRLDINLQLGGIVTVAHLVQPPFSGRLVFTLDNGFTFKGISPMAFTLGSTGTVHAQVVWVDAHGNAAVVDGPTAWSSSDVTIATAAVDGTDSTKCTVTSVGPLGPVQVVASADAQMGSGVTQIMATGDITVVAGEAVAGTITFTP